MGPQKRYLGSRKNGFSFYSRLSREEQSAFRDASLKFEEIKEALSPLASKHGIGVLELLSFVKDHAFFPNTIFSRKLTVLESVVKHLKEKGLALRRISQLIGRDERNIWNISMQAARKHPRPFAPGDARFWIPVSVIADTPLSALECVVCHLKEEFPLTYHEIAVLMERDDRTIWTVYQRARRKNAKRA